MSTHTIVHQERLFLSMLSGIGLYRPDIHLRNDIDKIAHFQLLDFETKITHLFKSLTKQYSAEAHESNFSSVLLREVRDRVLLKIDYKNESRSVVWDKNTQLTLPFIISSVEQGAKLHLWQKVGSLVSFAEMPSLSHLIVEKGQMCSLGVKGGVIKASPEMMKSNGYTDFPSDKRKRAFSGLCKKIGNEQLRAISIDYVKRLKNQSDKSINNTIINGELLKFSKKQ
jgi:hypothetical protein